MDYFCLLAITTELKSRLSGCRINTCHQVGENALVLDIRDPRRPESPRTLMFRTRGSNPGVFPLPDYQPPPGSSTLLARSFRKKISGSRIRDLDMPYPDRLIVIRLTAAEWAADRNLYFELRGSRSNLSCVDTAQSAILECFSKIPRSRDPEHPRMPGEQFRFPQPPESSGNLELTGSMTIQTLKDAMPGPTTDWKTLLNRIKPLTPSLAKALATAVNDRDETRFHQLIHRILKAGQNLMFDPVVELRTGRWELHAVSSGLPAEKRYEFDSILDAAIFWEYQTRQSNETSRLFSQISNALHRRAQQVRKNISALQTDLERLPDTGTIRMKADLLSANYHLLKPGQTSLTVPNLFAPDNPSVTIELDASLPPAIQIDRLFKTARKTDRAKPFIRKRMASLKAELDALQILKTELENAHDPETLQELKKRLNTKRLIADENTPKIHPSGDISEIYFKYRSSEGWNIWVGRNAAKNEIMTFKLSSPHDFWLHAEGYQGAHVIVRNPSRKLSLPRRTEQEAAELAVFHSSARGEKGVPVLVTTRKHLRHPAGGLPGRVIVREHRTVLADTPRQGKIPKEL
ncbi:NFACT family protein [bacterium]|nr:NFACT family protein [candidate division CSSED10-310 bacterium]